MITFVDFSDYDYQASSMRQLGGNRVKHLSARDELSRKFEITLQLIFNSEHKRIAKKWDGYKFKFREIDIKIGQTFVEIKTSLFDKYTIASASRQLNSFCDFVGFGHNQSTVIYISNEGLNPMSVLSDIGKSPVIKISARELFQIAVDMKIIDNSNLWNDALANKPCERFIENENIDLDTIKMSDVFNFDKLIFC